MRRAARDRPRRGREPAPGDAPRRSRPPVPARRRAGLLLRGQPERRRQLLAIGHGTPPSGGACSITIASGRPSRPVTSTGSTRPPISCTGDAAPSASSGIRPVVASHHHAPSALCPAPVTSAPAGVNERSRHVASARVGGSTNVVSDWLNSRAIAGITASSSRSASATTASGLPARGASAKTSTRANGTAALTPAPASQARTPRLRAAVRQTSRGTYPLGRGSGVPPRLLCAAR